jgi:hypothetical protein
MTLAMVTNAGKYDWPTWVLGIMRAFLSGGASALMTGAGGAVIGIPGKQVWILMGVNFVLMGLYRLGEFLQLHGAPDPIAAQAALQKAETAAKETVSAVADAKAAVPITKSTE